MSINVNDKNLGHATAYAYYKAGGGTMTEAEFTEFMADFGTASQTAVEAAQAALASKNAAQTAATTATNKATEATTAATTATTKAGEASTSASTATSAKDTAVSASQTATTKATEATTAAATATSAATTATTAKDDAVSAKTAAQTAQTGAETAAASVSASAAQIATNTEDISQLKSDLNDIFEKETSINLMPVAQKNATYGGVESTYADGVLTFSGTASVNGDGDAHRSDIITLDAGTYTFSRDEQEAQISLRKNSNTRVALLQGPAYSTTFTLNEQTDVYLVIGLAQGTVYDATLHLQLESGSTATPFIPPSYRTITAKDVVARNSIDEIGLPYETPILTWTAGKAFVYNAGWTDNSGWSYADVDLMQGQSLDIILHVYPSVYPLSVWSGDGNSIIKIAAPNPASEVDAHYIYTCSAQREKVRINVLNTYKTAVIAKVYKPNNLVNVSNILAENHSNNCYDVLHENVIAIGDSLTQGSYTGHDLHVNQSYPAFMAKTMGNTVVNAGRAGWTTKEWWDGDSISQKGFPYYTYTDYDTAVICLGTNGGLTDTLDTDVTPYESYTDYANTNTGCYCKIIDGMKAQNASINILLCNIWAGGGTGGIDVTNTVINKIAAKYGLPVIDLLNEFRTAYSIYHAVSGNIHLGRIGYARMADIIRQAINNNVLDRPANYNYIPS